MMNFLKHMNMGLLLIVGMVFGEEFIPESLFIQLTQGYSGIAMPDVTLVS